MNIMAPTLRCHKRARGVAVSVMKPKKPAPYLPFEIREMIIGEYIKKALAAMPDPYPTFRDLEKHAKLRACGKKSPSLSNLQRASYASYRDELVPALQRAIVAHTAKHAALKNDVLAVESKWAAYFNKDLTQAWFAEGSEFQPGAIFWHGGIRHPPRMQYANWMLSEHHTGQRRIEDEGIEAYDRWERVGAEIAYLERAVEYWKLLALRHLVL